MNVLCELSRTSGILDGTETNEVMLAQLREEALGLGSGIPEDFTQSLDALTQRVAGTKSQVQAALDTLMQEIGQLGGPS